MTIQPSPPESRTKHGSTGGNRTTTRATALARSCPGPSLTLRFAAWTLCAIVASGASAQFVSNRSAGVAGASGGGAAGGVGDASFQAAETSMNGALWNAGALRLDPWIGVREAGFVDSLRLTLNEEGTQTPQQAFDFRMVAGAGLRGYVPFGPHVIWSANALQEYNMWASETTRNQGTFSWATGLFVQGNRAGFDLRVSSRERQGFATSEVELLSNRQDDFVGGHFEIRMVRSLHLWVRGRDVKRRQTGLAEESQNLVAGLDRDESAISAGFRVQLGRSVDLSIGYEEGDSDFLSRDRSSESSAPLLDLSYNGPNLRLQLDMGLYDVKPKEGSQLQPFEEAIGEARLVINSSGRVQVTPYLRRYANYSITESSSHFLETRYGTQVAIPVATRMRLRLFAEGGSNAYEALDDAASGNRTDDVVAWGGSFTFPLSEHLSLSINGRSEDFSSTDPTFDRRRNSIGMGLGLGLDDIGNLDWAAWP